MTLLLHFGLSLVALCSVVDIRTHRIPKGLCFVVNSIAIFLFGIRGIAWCLLLYLCYLAIHRISSGALGYGDIRFVPAALLTHEGLNPFYVHLAAWVSAGCLVLIRRWLLGSEIEKAIPFAPHLLVALVFVPHLTVDY